MSSWHPKVQPQNLFACLSVVVFFNNNHLIPNEYCSCYICKCCCTTLSLSVSCCDKKKRRRKIEQLSSDDSHSSVKADKNAFSPEIHTSHTKHIVDDIFDMSVAIIKHLHWRRRRRITNLKNTTNSLCFWQTYDLETRWRPPNLVWIGRPRVRLLHLCVWQNQNDEVFDTPKHSRMASHWSLHHTFRCTSKTNQLYLGTEINTPVIPNLFQPCQCCCCLCYPGEYPKLGTLISYNWAQVLEVCDHLKLLCPFTLTSVLMPLELFVISLAFSPPISMP